MATSVSSVRASNLFVLPRVDQKPQTAMVAGTQQDAFDAGTNNGIPVPPGQPTPNLTQHGGALLKHPILQPIYLGNYWGTAAGKTARAWEDGFAKDFGKSSVAGVLNQYGVGASKFGGSVAVGRNIGAGHEITDAQIQDVVRQQLKAGHVKRNAEGIYTVVLPPGVILVASDGTKSTEGMAGYHGSFKGADGKPVYYAAIVTSDKKNGIDFDGKGRDAVTVTESHEWAEAETDPDVNSYDPNRTLGWYDDNINGEIGDLAIWELSKHQGNNWDFSKVWKRVDGYATQEEWSNKDHQFEVAPKAKGGASV